MNKNITASEIKRVMRENGLGFNKGLGQNFLADASILNKILTAARLDASCGVIEIGAGLGCLTRALSGVAGRVVSVEYDRGLYEYLTRNLKADNVTLMHADALKLDFAEIIHSELSGMEVHAVANLPYYITTPLLFKLLEIKPRAVSTITVMVQKEVAKRINAAPGTPDYGALSVAAQYYADVSVVCDAPPHCFCPPPNVASRVIKLTVKPYGGADEDALFRCIKAAFSKRRKTLSNALHTSGLYSADKQSIADAVKRVCGNADARGESLSLAQFIQLSALLR